MLKAFFFLLLTLVTLNSEAQGLRCFDLFAQNQVTAKKDSYRFYAEAIDSLNAKYNGMLFKKNVSDILEPQLADSPFWERTSMRYRAYKLRKVLKKLHDFDQYLNSSAEADVYSLEKISVQLEKLTFLTDESVIQKMSLSDKILYRQAQHSLLSQGLARFLFSNDPLPPPSTFKKIYTFVMIPFRDIYFRWTYAAINLPKLDGAVIPLEVLEKIAWEGVDNNRELLAKYLLKSQSKYFFNVFSVSYNWIMAGTLFVAAGHFADSAYDVYAQGQIKAQQMLEPGLEQSSKIAQTDWVQFKQKRRLENFLIEFRNEYHREPTAEEMTWINQLIDAPYNQK